MIHQLVYAHAGEIAVGAGLFGSTPGSPYDYVPYTNTPAPKVETKNTWAAVKKCLEGTGDHIIWIVTSEQLHGFMGKVRQHGLEKYLVVRQDGDNQGTTNRNYPDMKKRLKTFIMKGSK